MRDNKSRDHPRKRKPPKFQHLPAPQAIKAKQAWVKKVKLRSQWSKEKRKLLTDHQDGGEGAAEDTLDHETDEEMKEKDSNSLLENSQEKSQKQQRQAPVHYPSNSRPAPENDKLKQQREKIRDLTRQAYSRQTLHTFKSNSSKKTASRDQGRSENSSGRLGGVTGRGQPNMKLRMNALLEKIKLDAGVS
ncbi:hypothetical protein CPB86DRAFT_870176 [Serendipita vermifera]|nr:hypothetical protein CPB86DRAFT_870176 [Serendipita vermifera]